MNNNTPDYDNFTEQYISINESLNEYVKANVEIATWMLKKQNAQLKELLKETKDYLPEFETPMDILAKIDEALP